MKTSNKLLLVFFVINLVMISWLFGTAKYYYNNDFIETSGNMTTENREVKPFTKVRVQGKFDVTITQGDRKPVEVVADENVIPEVITEVVGDELIIRLNNKIRDHKHIKVNVSTEAIEALNFSAGSKLSTNGEISGNKLDLESYAGSHGSLSIKYDKVYCNSYAGSSLKIEGNANEIEIRSTAGSDIAAANLSVSSCNVKGQAGSNVAIHVTEELVADMSSGASLRYSGNPTKTNFNSSAGGSINKR